MSIARRTSCSSRNSSRDSVREALRVSVTYLSTSWRGVRQRSEPAGSIALVFRVNADVGGD